MSASKTTSALFLLPVLLATLAGCTDSLSKAERRGLAEERMQTALRLERAGKIDAAMAQYEDILKTDSFSALAGLHLAILLQDSKRDQASLVKATHLYQKYMETNPDSEKIDLVQTRYRKICDILADDFGVSDGSDITTPLSGNKASEPTSVFQELPVDVPIQIPEDERGAGTIASASVSKEYFVQEGDSLSKIAKKVYGDESKWEIIYEANRTALKSSNNLKVGQKLVVP